jgi:hypothetical protein
MTTLYWLRYLFLVVLVAVTLWIVWRATADVRPFSRRVR